MDHATVLARYDRELRERARPDSPAARVERAGDVIRHVGSTAQDWNGVLWSALDADGADAAIAEQVAHFSALGHPFEWKLYGHDRPADLGRRLTAAGFTAEPEETLMVAEVTDLSLDAALPEGVRLHTVTDEAGVDLMIAVHDKAFGPDDGALRHRLLAQLTTAPDTLVAVVALAGAEPVSAARMEMPPGTGFAGLWGGGTAEQWRGRGIYRALVAHRARIAADRGYRYLHVDAGSESRPILERLGFVPLTTTTPYVYEP
ncbi:GNAT family N-acetyltransferase [Streptomyces sp. NRRL S-340]|uniref:GNAT family N-acetyltransferase n=1 Tax=Streptomyces sp. NRRL S-340 TaxID=1463901 RepID=UPI00055B347C|nr:GNAT family N-acetyltransferase [Streptomyces sp. NRRL S-340]